MTIQAKINTKQSKQSHKRNTTSSLPLDPKNHFENLCSDTKCLNFGDLISFLLLRIVFSFILYYWIFL